MRKAWQFEKAGGNPLKAWREEMFNNIPPNWIERAVRSRQATETALLKLKKSGKLTLKRTEAKKWLEAYQKESFYRGLRILMELERGTKRAQK